MTVSSAFSPTCSSWAKKRVPLLGGQKFSLCIQIRPRPIHLKFRSIQAHAPLKLTAQNFSAIMNNQSTWREQDAVIIVDHGSRRQESNSMLHAFVDMYKEKTGHPIVEPAHMELAKPTIKEAFDSCVKQGAARVIISPYFLSPGRHWKQDIPALAAEAAKEHPGIPYIITAPLGLHEHMVNVVEDRIKHCLSKVAGDSEECEICSGSGQCQQRVA